MPLVIYLAARYSRRPELLGYAEELRALGHTVDCRWLLGYHQWDKEAQAVESAQDSVPVEASRFAMDDVEDLRASDLVVSFSEAPRGSNSRGGRHVEFGLALGWGKRVAVVGPRENVFHCLPQVEWYRTWARFLAEAVL